MFINLTAANDTLYGIATLPAKLFAHGQRIRNCYFTLTIDSGPKKITTLKKQCILGIGIGNSPIQHLHIRPYNSYYHCEEICSCRGESLVKC